MIFLLIVLYFTTNEVELSLTYWLYNEGDFGKSGGFVNGNYHSAQSRKTRQNAVEESNRLILHPSTGQYFISVRTNNIIDFSKYNTLYVERQNLASTAEYATPFIALIKNADDYMYETHLLLYEPPQLQPSEKKLEVIDITSVNESGYINFSTENGRYGAIYKVYLTK